jgi:hypothetical protein
MARKVMKDDIEGHENNFPYDERKIIIDFTTFGTVLE